jgi:CobQ-like glutamine amidotransferase family enzyme
MANNIEKTSKDVAALKENVRLADMLIAKIDDKKYRQMIATYRTLVKAI